ncbi:hypothetical protein ATK30_6862 [Amycolatopsis echigonensis]|uniref:Minor tail protein n=1 Tax=Amycolatopsis echigonensis TaxID=2576905 RepID=A0A2N3WPY3_9PSEU|nr:hypothetical protein [Amycolatopsis niigatensis]PKV95929.1 hypothetical protein ATK30_6862 [Amycolatopsis niigatensis]
MTERAYTALAYDTVTGRFLADIDLQTDPTWSARINDTGGWQIVAELQDRAHRDVVRGWCVPWRTSVAILYGATVCQAGPIVGYAPSDSQPQVQISGKGIWEMFNHRLLFNAAWDPTAKPITDPSADFTVNGPLYKIARELVNNAMNWQHRAGGGLPIDLPAQVPDDYSNTRTWHGWEMATPGQRLQELTQVQNGPDVLFQPYLTVVNGFRTIRHQLLIGSPYLQQRGVPLNFNFGNTLVSMTVQGDGTSQANSAFVKGTGNEAGTLYGYATNNVRVQIGWPALDMVDSNHTSVLDPVALNAYAAGDLTLYGSVPEQWEAVVLADADPQWGQYLPGHFANYSFQDHPWIPDGTYSQRILGVSDGGGQSGQRATVKHQLQNYLLPLT